MVTENFAVGAMERMGLGYENLRAIREDIILLSISGNGQTGPYARDISYGIPSAPSQEYMAFAGTKDLNRWSRAEFVLSRSPP